MNCIKIKIRNKKDFGLKFFVTKKYEINLDARGGKNGDEKSIISTQLTSKYK